MSLSLVESLRSSTYPLAFLKDKFNHLPSGVMVVDKKGEFKEILHDIKYRKLSREDMKIIHDTNYAKNHPVKHLARICCLVTESIGKNPVYEAFKQLNFTDFPDIIKNLPMSDTAYIVVCGHIHNFGWDVTKVRATCINSACQHDQILPDVSLKSIQVEFSEENCHLVTVNLEDGIEVSMVGQEAKTINYNVLSMRIPCIEDALKYERFYRPNDQGDFFDRIYAECTIGLSGVGGELGEERIRALGPSLFRTMTASDSTLLEGGMNSNPTIIMLTDSICSRCSDDLPVLIKQDFLFPKRR